MSAIRSHSIEGRRPPYPDELVLISDTKYRYFCKIKIVMELPQACE